MNYYKGILPAVLARDKDTFEKRLQFAKNEVDAVHIDFIDGAFVPNQTLPIKEWPKVTCRYSEAHLMASEPIKWLEKVKEKNITRAVIHVESSFEIDELLSTAKRIDLLISFTIAPDTNLSIINTFLEHSSHFQIMGVEPGTIGQVFIESTYLTLNYINSLRSHSRPIVSVDGGVRLDNVAKIKNRQVDYLITSAALYRSGDWHDNLIALQEEWDNAD